MNLSYLKTYQEVQDWLQGKDLSVVAFDTETDGLRFGSPIVGISLCNGTDACYINLFNNLEYHRILLLIWKEFDIGFDSSGGKSILIGHNLSYDLKVLKFYNIEPHCYLYDTMVAAHLLNENAKCGLKDLMKRKLKWTDVKEWKEVAPLGYDSKEFQEYGIKDVIATWKLYELTKPLLAKGGFDNLFYNIEMPFQRVIVDLETNGIGVDQDYLEDLDDTLTAERVILEEKCVLSLGMKMLREKNLFGFEVVSSPINLNSSKQLLDIIQNKLKIKLPYTTKKGNPSTKSECLKVIRTKHPFIDLLLQYRKVEKLHNTFIEPLWGQIDSDSRVRSSVNDAIPRTGRLSYSNPNNQQLPSSKKKDIYGVRKIYRAKEGYVFVQGDWSGQELRGCAHVSGDQNMIQAFLADKDLHLATANEWLKLEIPNEHLFKTHPAYKNVAAKYEKERDRGKNGVNFPIVYGTTAKGIALRQGIDEEMALAGIEAFFTLYPDVRKAVKQCRKDLFAHNCVVTMLGRKRRFWEINDKAIRQAFNFLIQGFFADVLRIAMVNIRQLFLDHPEWDAKLVLTVHDSITAECPKECAEVVSKEMQHVMETSYKLSIPLPADMCISETLK
jgi:DNA polymerase-1